MEAARLFAAREVAQGARHVIHQFREGSRREAVRPRARRRRPRPQRRRHPDDAAKTAAANAAAGDAILDYIKAQNLSATGLTVTFDGATSTVSVFGVAPDQATKEKIALCCGNVAGVEKVNNMMSVDQSAPEATYYTVVSGDNLSKISKAQYGDPNKYMKIFDANKPMLQGPGQDLPGSGAAHPAALTTPWRATTFRGTARRAAPTTTRCPSAIPTIDGDLRRRRR